MKTYRIFYKYEHNDERTSIGDDEYQFEGDTEVEEFIRKEQDDNYAYDVILVQEKLDENLWRDVK